MAQRNLFLMRLTLRAFLSSYRMLFKRGEKGSLKSPVLITFLLRRIFDRLFELILLMCLTEPIIA